MAGADGTIRVDIIGDAKGLQSTLKTADKGIAGFANQAKTIAGGLLIGGVVGAVGGQALEFLGDALDESDRLGDAIARLKFQLGELAPPLIETADDFTRLGQSKQDMLELEAAFADIATALGISDPFIADMADDVAATAAAVALLTGQDPADVVKNIGNAAGGAEKPLKALGVNLNDADVNALALHQSGKLAADSLTDGEKASARLTLILMALNPQLVDAQTGTRDLEQRTGELTAKWETFTGSVGAALEGPLIQILDWFDDAAFAVDTLGKLLGHLADQFGILDGLQGLLGGGGAPRRVSPGAGRPQSVTVNVHGGDPVVVERAVGRAVKGITQTNGLPNPLASHFNR